MKVSLWTLNESWQALMRLASKELKKKDFKVTYKLGRFVDWGKPHIDRWAQKDWPGMLAAHGLRQLGDRSIVSVADEKTEASASQIDQINLQAEEIMKETVCDLGGDDWQPLDAKTILDLEPLQRAGREEAIITALDFGLLYGWLITGELPDEPEKAE